MGRGDSWIWNRCCSGVESIPRRIQRLAELDLEGFLRGGSPFALHLLRYLPDMEARDDVQQALRRVNGLQLFRGLQELIKARRDLRSQDVIR